MPKPMIWNGKCYIDYYAELELKSKFQLELYTMSHNSLIRRYLNRDEPLGEILKEGVLVVEKDRYFETENQIRQNFQDIKYSISFMKNMYAKLSKFKEETILFEKRLNEKLPTQKAFNDYVESLLELMTLFCMQWLSFDLKHVSKITGCETEALLKLFSPMVYAPFQFRYDHQLLNCLKAPSTENFENFILHYAFLNNFEIDKNPFEDMDYLTAYAVENVMGVSEFEATIASRKSRMEASHMKRQVFSESILSKLDKADYETVLNNFLLIRACADEEEERHYLQARATRNVRCITERLNMSPYSEFMAIKNSLEVG